MMTSQDDDDHEHDHDHDHDDGNDDRTPLRQTNSPHPAPNQADLTRACIPSCVRSQSAVLLSWGEFRDRVVIFNFLRSHPPL